jgi:hypothetical protein
MHHEDSLEVSIELSSINSLVQVSSFSNTES